MQYGAPGAGRLSVDFPAVPDLKNENNQFPVLNRVDNAPISNANAPVIPLTFQFLDAGRAGIVFQSVERGKQTLQQGTARRV